MAIRVLIADGAELLRLGVRTLLECEPDILVVGEISQSVDAPIAVERDRPNVVLLELGHGQASEIEVIRTISENGASTPVKVIVLASPDQDQARPDFDEALVKVLSAGAVGYLLKTVSKRDLVRAVREVSCGNAIIDPSMTQCLLDRLKSHRADRVQTDGRLFERLTDRERTVLVLMCCGSSNRDISVRLSIAMSTVKSHVNRVMRKLDVHDRTQAVAMAYRSGFMTDFDAADEGIDRGRTAQPFRRTNHDNGSQH